MACPMSENVTQVTNHWWWRPGWRTGRHFYACHLTLNDQPELRALVAEYQAATKELAMLDPIPAQWLHLTTQGIGFVDEISRNEFADIRYHLTESLRKIALPVLTFEHPTIWPEAVYLRARPAESLYRVRQRIHDAVLTVLGSERFTEPMPKPEDYTPHVSVAYVNDDASAAPIAAALARVRAKPVTATFTKADLLVFHRDNKMYEWTSATPISFGMLG